MTAVGVIVFIVALLVSVMIHEWGHMTTARRFGCKVSEFFVGFGPKIWAVRRGETEYGIKAVPAGGYVRIIGMNDLEEIHPEDEPRAFYRKPTWQRVIVLAAGSTMHFVIAAVLLVVVALAVGRTVHDPSSTLGPVSQTISRCASTDVNATCDDKVPAPAAAAGLKAGDRITSVAGHPVNTWKEFTTQVRAEPAGTPLSVTYLRDGKPAQTTVTTVLGLVSDDQGNPVHAPVFGVGDVVSTTHPGFFSSVGDGLHQFGTFTWLTIKGIGAIPGQIPQLFNSVFGNAPRNPNGIASVVGVAQASGEVTQNGGFAQLVSLIAATNIGIGLINLVPIPPLDGGHIAVAFFESARRRIYRLFGREDPGRVDANRLVPIFITGLVIVIGFGLLAITADITNPIKLPS